MMARLTVAAALTAELPDPADGLNRLLYRFDDVARNAVIDHFGHCGRRANRKPLDEVSRRVPEVEGSPPAPPLVLVDDLAAQAGD